MDDGRPTLRDVLRARTVIARFLPRTPLIRYPSLDAVAGTALYLKHENHQPVGAFKVRGGLYLLSQLSDEERARGVIAASTGNHGQSVAYAANRFGVRAIVGVPEGAKGVVITEVDPDSASADAGLKVGDVIHEINREPITSSKQAVELSEKVKKDKKVLLRVSTKGSSRFVVVEHKD